jgi:hypothetical protein
VAAAALLATLALGVAASPADAHTAAVTGKAVCDTTSGDWAVTWTVTNDFPAEVTLEKVVSAPDGSPVKDLPPTIKAAPKGGHTGITATQAVPGSSSSARLAFTATWYKGPGSGDDFSRTAEATVTFDGTCGTTPTPGSDRKCVSAKDAKYEHEFDGRKGTAVVRVAGELPLCEGVEQDFALASYTAPAGKFSLPQYLYNSDVGTLTAKTRQIELSVDVPPCFYQVDLVWGGDVLKKLDEGSLYGDRVLGSPKAPGNGSAPVAGKVVNTNGGGRAVFNGGDGTCDAQPAALFADDCDATVVTLKNTGVRPAEFVVEKQGDKDTWTTVKTVTLAQKESKAVEVKPGSGAIRVRSGDTVVAEHTWTLPAECVQQGEVTAAAESTCTELVLTLSNDLGENTPPVEFVVTAPGAAAKTIAVKPGTSTKYSVQGLKSGAKVAVGVGDEAEDFAFTPPKNCAPTVPATPAEGTSGGGGLPVTGVALPVLGGLAAALLAAGAALVLVGRRRRTTGLPADGTSAE